MTECPWCGDPDDPVEGHCWTCGHRRGFPVELWATTCDGEPEPPQDQMWTDQQYIRSLEEPIL